MGPPAAAGEVSGPEAARLLAEGVGELGLDLGDRCEQALLQFAALLLKWNRVYNLTAIQHPDDVVARHLLDSLSLLPFLEGKWIADVGSGAGFPGLPLALACPQRQFVLIESREKRVHFLTQAVADLGLGNVEIVGERAERYVPKVFFDTVVARAFGSIADLARCAGHLRSEAGVILAMKGVYPAEELAEVSTEYTVKVVPVRVPRLSAERHVVILRHG